MEAIELLQRFFEYHIRDYDVLIEAVNILKNKTGAIPQSVANKYLFFLSKKVLEYCQKYSLSPKTFFIRALDYNIDDNIRALIYFAKKYDTYEDYLADMYNKKLETSILFSQFQYIRKNSKKHGSGKNESIDVQAIKIVQELVYLLTTESDEEELYKLQDAINNIYSIILPFSTLALESYKRGIDNVLLPTTCCVCGNKPAEKCIIKNWDGFVLSVPVCAGCGDCSTTFPDVNATYVIRAYSSALLKLIESLDLLGE